MCFYPVKLYKPEGDVTVSCGKCVECLKKNAIEWSYRIMAEASQYENNCFITLTYRDNPVSLNKSDYQKFLKRLRFYLGDEKIRYFGCGEYGSKGQRPHYHFIIFNWFPDDAFFFKRDGDNDLYRSPTLERLWTAGFSSVGRVTSKTALYTAKYLQKLVDPPRGVVAPFVMMSKRPGLGYNVIHHNMLLTDKVYYEGKSLLVPRYFLKVFEREGVVLDDFKASRLSRIEDVDYKQVRLRRYEAFKFYGKLVQTEKCKVRYPRFFGGRVKNCESLVKGFDNFDEIEYNEYEVGRDFEKED